MVLDANQDHSFSAVVTQPVTGEVRSAGLASSAPAVSAPATHGNDEVPADITSLVFDEVISADITSSRLGHAYWI